MQDRLRELDARIEALQAEAATRGALRERYSRLEDERSALETSMQSDLAEDAVDAALARLRAVAQEYIARRSDGDHPQAPCRQLGYTHSEV